MKKFLLILFIVIAASTKVQHLLFRKLEKDYLMHDYLSAHGYYDQIVDLLKKYGKPTAIDYCQKKAGFLLAYRCKSFIEQIEVRN